MKIVIVGYGKMGKATEQEAAQLSIPVSKIINSVEEINNSQFASDEVAIEFTAPSVCVENIKLLTEKGVSVVCGTTSWHDKLSEVEQMVKKHNTALFYAENFSIGVNTFYRIVAEAAKLFNGLSYYDPMIYEAHHKNKKDAPSGTAKKAAEVIVENIARKDKYVIGNVNRALAPEEVHVSSARCGTVIGDHKVIFDSEYDSIEVNHFSKGRRGYALGAVKCAEWIQNKKGVFTMNDYMKGM